MHSVHYFLHCSESKCDLCETPEMCQDNYDKEFVSEFEKFLVKDSNISLSPTDSEGVSGDNFLKYIEAHLQAKKCPSPCSRLWKYCVDNKLVSLLQHAPEGLLIYSSNRQSEVGTIIDTYSGYRDVNMIGRSGFGNVYQYRDIMAVKEEFKKPLINGNLFLFQWIMELEHDHVIKVLEYIVAPYYDESNSENKCFLSVMPFKNQMDLRKQFTKEKHLTCVLDYMTKYPNQEKFIFRNYTVLLRHIFKGLCYLKSKEIVHRDIKSSNILVHQECGCESPLQCICTGDGKVTYLLGDLDLLSLEKETSKLTYTCDEWKKMTDHDPAGTIGMKPPESFFRTEKGAHVTTHKSDVWSACATVMNVLIGKAVNKEAQEQISKFMTATTEGAKIAATIAAESLDLLKSIMNLFEQMKGEQRNTKISQLSTKLNELKQLLTNAEKSFHQSQSFQGGFRKIYKEENPLAGILTTAYGAHVLQWKCFKKLQHVYNTQLWSVIEPTLDAIVAGIKFVPHRRQDATRILEDLTKVPAVDCSNDG